MTAIQFISKGHKAQGGRKPAIQRVPYEPWEGWIRASVYFRVTHLEEVGEELKSQLADLVSSEYLAKCEVLTSGFTSSS